MRLVCAPARASLLAASVTAVALVAVAAPALSQTLERDPVIDDSPRSVGFSRTAIVRGHLENSAPTDEVAFQKRRASRGFKTIAAHVVDDQGRVVFRAADRRTTGDYRLAHLDDGTGTVSTSRVVRIRVRPKLTMRVRPRDLMQGRSATVRGSLWPARSGREVMVQRRRSGAWRTIQRVRAGDGSYRASLALRDAGLARVRVRFAGDGANTGKARTRSVHVYDPELATWYGPGFYGHRTACGQILGYSTLGVAHRTLPCGTKLSLLYRGRTVTVRVIDRGPYGSASYDLTRETSDRLNFSGKDQVGVVRGG